MLYLDTSLLVSFLTNENHSETVRAWMARRETGELAVSAWVVVEFTSALSMKLRMGRIDADRRAQAMALFRRMVSDTFAILAVSELDFRSAANLVERQDLGVRSGDALHLAIARANGATLCTLDRRLAAAGPPLATETLLV
ncbi:MAG: type II toxin-antitoxin system VapC family toxin [Caulobacteraceae bacterium]